MTNEILELKAQLLSLEGTYKLQKQKIKKFVEELKEMIEPAYEAELIILTLDELNELTSKHFPEITNQSHQETQANTSSMGEFDRNSNISKVRHNPDDNTSEQVTENRNRVLNPCSDESQKTVSEDNNLGCQETKSDLFGGYFSDGSTK